MNRAEAIKIIKTATVYTPEEMEALETLIPELKESEESEEERVRKDIIGLIKFALNDGSAVSPGSHTTKEEAISWLEKQKENPKSADSIPSDCVSDAKCEDKSPKHSDSDGTDIRDTPAYWKGWDDAMKQKEQKPAWSEEDEEMLEEIINHIDTTSVQRIPARPGSAIGKSWIKFLKSLRPQPKQEWSEEDVDMLNSCISSIEEAKENRYAYKETDGDTSYDHEIAWLKSLRPHWKPSEEQMKALFNAKGFLRAGLQYDSAKAIAVLYEQLKQL